MATEKESYSFSNTGQVRILHLIKSLGRGGAEKLLPETLRFHNRQRFDWGYAYYLPWKNQMVGELEQHGVRVECFNLSNNFQILLGIPRLVHYLLQQKIQILHAHLPWAGIAGRIAGRIAGIKVVYTEHNRQERYHVVTRLLNLWTLGLCHQVVAVSGEVAASIRRFKGAEFPVTVIKNGVNTEKFDPQSEGKEIKSRLGIPPRSLVVGNVCVFRVQKRLDVWVDAAARLIRDNPDVYFLLVGAGPLFPRIEEEVQKRGLVNRLLLPGLQVDARPYLAAMDIFMMTSEFEGLPVAMLEAMAMEKAIVSTDVGGIPEVVTDGIEGYLVPGTHPEECATKVNLLLHDPARILACGKKARERVSSAFSIKQMVESLEHLYDQLSPD